MPITINQQIETSCVRRIYKLSLNSSLVLSLVLVLTGMKFRLFLIILYAILCLSISTTTINNEQYDENALLLESKLLEAVSSQNLIEIEKAIENGDDINISNVHGWTATMFAITTNNLEILQYLIKHEADLNLQNDDGNTVLMLAAAEVSEIYLHFLYYIVLVFIT